MPRNTKGISRTGSKHKKKAVADPDVQSTISEAVSGPPSNPVPQKTATAVDKVAAQSGPAPSVEDLVDDFGRLGAPGVPFAHAWPRRYAAWRVLSKQQRATRGPRTDCGAAQAWIAGGRRLGGHGAG